MSLRLCVCACACHRFDVPSQKDIMKKNMKISVHWPGEEKEAATAPDGASTLRAVERGSRQKGGCRRCAGYASKLERHAFETSLPYLSQVKSLGSIG